MKKIVFPLVVLILVFTFGVTVWSHGQTASGSLRNIVLIGWDGAQRKHIKECLGREELPNLKKLVSEGILVAIDVLRTTDTKAGWSQILTGYEPEITGVYSNSRFQSIPKGYTVFERLEQFFGPDNFVTVAVIAKKGNLGAKEGEPYYYTKKSMDVFVNGLEKNDVVGSLTLKLLERYKDRPFFFFVHFAEVDSNGHQSGEDSQEYNNALVSVDRWLGQIVNKLNELNLYGETLIYVTADHGFDDGQKTHSDAPYVFLGTNDPLVMRRGERADIAPTILERFGIDLGTIQPPLSGHSLTRPYDPPIW
jgi:hypothetical protein